MKQTDTRIRVADHSAAGFRFLHLHIKKKLWWPFKCYRMIPTREKHLKDESEGLMSYRVSCFRIIYRVGFERRIEIIAIGPREGIHEETYRLIRKQEIR